MSGISDFLLEKSTERVQIPPFSLSLSSALKKKREGEEEGVEGKERERGRKKEERKMNNRNFFSSILLLVLLYVGALCQTFTGDATYYTEANGTGACSFDASTDVDIAALNIQQWAGSGWCGGCAQLAGPLGNVTVKIVDQCPGCVTGDLDLHPQAFDKIANRIAGRVTVNWQFVSCPVTGNLQYKYKDGISGYWIAIQIRNHRIPISSLEIKDNGVWVALARQDYNFFTRTLR
eukprot:TRINITY_DN3497_c0_g1_i1.p2 TRINITY_DN3497_c0_g1~~TRINITY_DN3497_c0_g1_i1.p2  ORF type:complete len:234 (+),score=73.74 TRINITY_DN3497_c0_g1_i1:77-778(+)